MSSKQSGASQILEERSRQVYHEGFTSENDDKSNGEFAIAAVCYALPPGWPSRIEGRAPNIWPWSESWWKPGDGSTEGRVKELVKAGALIAAEIDRLQRTLI